MASFGPILLLTLASLAPGPEPLAAEDVMALPAEVTLQLEQHLAGAGSREQRLERVFDFVFGNQGLALQYGGDSTLTVAQTLQTRRANCLSFSLLFVALARQAGLDAYVQEIERVLVWHEQGGLVYNAGHANAGVRIGPRRFSVDINRSLVVAGSPPRAIADGEALARFYNNRGVELLAAGELFAARRQFERALAQSPDFVALQNNLGVLATREGQWAAALGHFERALQLDSGNGAALFNLVALHERQGNEQEASRMRLRLERVRSADPFHQYLLGDAAERRGDLGVAVEHYRRAIRLLGDEHRFHFGLARAYARLGDLGRARSELIRARNLADESQRPIYQAKLDGLRQEGPARR